MASKWDADANKEDRKLAPKEDDWELPAKRMLKRRPLMGGELSSETESEGSHEDEESESSEEEEDHEKGKPPAT